jgi:large subunit ribosomal protein L32e
MKLIAMKICQLQLYQLLESEDNASKKNIISLRLVHELFQTALNFLIISFLSEIFSWLGTYLFQNSRVTLMSINKDKLAKRQEIKEHNPEFVRPESWRYVRLQTNWRKPKGIDHHQRKQKSRGRPGLVKVGYGGPKEAKGLHPSGFTDNLVYNLNDLEKLDPKTDGVRFAHGVGTKKRKEIVVKAIERKFKIFNARVSVSGS